MIRISYRAGWLLIPQPAHAWVSGTMARQWGNASTARTTPYQAVVLGTTFHDVGWLSLDDNPTINHNGEPQNFIEPALDDVREMYQRTVSYVAQIDLYAGILVNRHVQLIYRRRAAVHGRDTMVAVHPLLDELQAQETAARAILQHNTYYTQYLDSRTLEHNYRILRICDLLSLFLCGALPATTIEDVPLGYNEAFTTMHCTWINEEILHIQPYVFAEPELDFTVSGRYIPQKIFESTAQFRESYKNAEVVTLSRRIISG